MAFWKSNRRRIGLLGLGLGLVGLCVVVLTPKPDPAPQAIEPTPADVSALHTLDARVRAATRTVSSAVVAVAGNGPEPDPAPCPPQGYASGVIISADGLVLSQFHVSHRYEFRGDPGEQERSRRPGERTTVILHDGRVVPAELLGADPAFDLSLLRLLEPGPYPHAPVEPRAEVALGDWVLKFGHPTGYRRDRGAVVRLGRVVSKEGSLFVTDCHITGGDSGGPFFDLEGRLVGIPGDSQVPPALNNTGLALPPQLYNCLSSSPIREFVPRMLRAEMTAAGRSAKAERIRQLAQTRNILPTDRWTQGVETASAFRDVVGPAAAHVVEIRDASDRPVAAGTVVGADGWILTVASLVPAEPRCRLPDQRVVPAKVVRVNRPFDLALLKVAEPNLSPVEWARDQPGTRVGTLLAAPSATPTPDRPLLGVGIVSVPTRDLPGPFPEQREHARIRADAPGLFGTPTDRGFRLDTIDASIAGDVHVGDMLVAIGEKPVRSQDDVRSAADGRRPGDRVVAHLSRNGRPVDVSIELRAKPITWTKPYGNLPTLFEHDMPLPPDRCGGTVIDLNGKAVGVTVFRGKYGCLAVPAECVERVLPEMKAH